MRHNETLRARHRSLLTMSIIQGYKRPRVHSRQNAPERRSCKRAPRSFRTKMMSSHAKSPSCLHPRRVSRIRAGNRWALPRLIHFL